MDSIVFGARMGKRVVGECFYQARFEISPDLSCSKRRRYSRVTRYSLLSYWDCTL